MTERTRKSGVRKLYESCRSLVGPLTLVVTLSAGAVYAGAWEEFEQRCLVPMENFEFPDVADLTRVSRKLESDGLHYRDQYLQDANGYAMFIVKHVISTGDAVSCGVDIQQAPRFDTLFSDFEKDFQERIEAGRYQPDPRWSSESIRSYFSTNWREPKLVVGGADGTIPMVSFWAEETDLES